MSLFPNKPRMMKMFDGRMAVRPIPVELDSSDARAIAVAAADQKPLGEVVNMPSRPSVGGLEAVFGTPVSGSATVRGGVYQPLAGNEGTLGS